MNKFLFSKKKVKLKVKKRYTKENNRKLSTYLYPHVLSK